MIKRAYHLVSLPGRGRDRRFRVSIDQADGTVAPVGTIRYFYVRHLERHGWEATGPDGHLAVHDHQWQALWALTWDRRGYPFPVVSSRQREVTVISVA